LINQNIDYVSQEKSLIIKIGILNKNFSLNE